MYDSCPLSENYNVFQDACRSYVGDRRDYMTWEGSDSSLLQRSPAESIGRTE